MISRTNWHGAPPRRGYERLDREQNALVLRIRLLERRLEVAKREFVRETERDHARRQEAIDAALRELLAKASPIFDQIVELALEIEALRNAAEDRGVMPVSIAIADGSFGLLDAIVSRRETPLTEGKPEWPRRNSVKAPRSGRIFRRQGRSPRGSK